MNGILILHVIFLFTVIFSNVQSKSVLRNGREIEKVESPIQPVEMQSILNEVETTYAENNTNVDDKVINNAEILRQNTEEVSTIRPTLLQQAQQIISNNPFGQFIETIRRPLVSANSSNTSIVSESTSPNILQQFQTGVQSFGNQLTNVFTPSENNLQGSESALVPSTVRPNLIDTISTNFQNAVQNVQNVFRPNEVNSGGASPPGPLQSVLTNVQNFFTGNRREPEQNTTPLQQPEPNVDDKVDYVLSRSSEEVNPISEDLDEVQSNSQI